MLYFYLVDFSFIYHANLVSFLYFNILNLSKLWTIENYQITEMMVSVWMLPLKNFNDNIKVVDFYFFFKNEYLYLWITFFCIKKKIRQKIINV